MKEGKIVFGEEDCVHYMYVVLKGRVQVYKTINKKANEEQEFEIKDAEGSGEQPVEENFVGLLNFKEARDESNDVVITRYVDPGFSFGEGKFLSLDFMESSSLESLAMFIKKFQNNPSNPPQLEHLSSSISNNSAKQRCSSNRTASRKLWQPLFTMCQIESYSEGAREIPMLCHSKL